MYLYNLTVIIDPDHETQIVHMIQEVLFADEARRIRLLKMLDSGHEGVTYCLQFHADGKNAGDKVQKTKLVPLQNRLESSFPGKVFFFESVMQYV